MNPTAIYSKSGKGVQEAAGKTSILSRPDRAVLSAIDGRVTLADVAQKVGKPFDQAFQGLISKLDKDGFIREVSPGSSAPAGSAKPAPAKAGAGRPAPAAEAASDLDFSSLGGPSRSPSPPPRAAPPQPKAPPPPPPKPAAPPPPPPRDQESSLFKARQEAEAKADAAREKARKEAEEKVRAEAETKLRVEAEARAKAEAEAKLAADAEAKIKAAREAAARIAAEAKAKADAEAKRAREDAERARQEAEEKAERARKEAEAEAKRAREEAERARKEAEERERKAREEAERERKKLEEERRKLEEERKRREKEDAERKAREEEERAERRRREEEEEKEREQARRRKREEEEQREAEEREARRKAREEEEAREAEERSARRKQREEEAAAEEAREAEARAAKKAKKKAEPVEEEEEPVAEKPKARPAPAAPAGGFADSLMADLDSFNTREEEEAKAKEEEERKAREERERKAREEAERREREEAERKAKEEKQREKEEKERAKREEKERLKREEEEEKQRIKEEEEKREREAEERKRKAKEEEALARKAQSAAVADLQDEKRRAKMLAAGRRRDADEVRKKGGWGKPVAITLFLILVAALGAAHIMPIGVTDYQNAASEALGRPVRIGSARLWLVTGVQIRFDDVTAGDAKIGRVVAHPSIASLTEPRKQFSLIELEKVTLPQSALDEVLFASTRSDNFSVARVSVRELELPGTLAFPKRLQAELSLDPEGKVRLATLRGTDGLVAKLEPKGTSVDFDFSANAFTLPIAPEITFSSFAMKGSATAAGMTIKEWDGEALNGRLTGAARVRWAGNNWNVDGVITARGVSAAVFAPALLSEGRAEGTGKFSMAGTEPAKLASSGSLEGNFTIHKGVLGSFDLSRAIQTGGRQAQGRTQFTEMTGQGSYDRGAVQLRNVTIGAGALNAGASADIAQNGALSGRIVADVRTASNTLRATLLLGGTVKEPQVRN